MDLQVDMSGLRLEEAAMEVRKRCHKVIVANGKEAAKRAKAEAPRAAEHRVKYKGYERAKPMADTVTFREFKRYKRSIGGVLRVANPGLWIDRGWIAKKSGKHVPGTGFMELSVERQVRKLLDDLRGLLDR